MQLGTARISDSLNKGIRPREEYIRFVKTHDHVVNYLCAILRDCYEINPLYSQTGYRRDMNTIVNRFQCEGLSFATQTLPRFFDGLLTYLETGNSVYPSFKLMRGKSYPVFLQQLTMPIYTDCTSDHAVLCMKLLYQLCVAFKKLKGPYKTGVLVKQLDEFVETDQSFNADNLFVEGNSEILEKARNIIRQVIRGTNPFDPGQSELFLPKPGPGATNLPTKRHERYHASVNYTQLSESFDYDEWFTSQSAIYRGHKAWILTEDRVFVEPRTTQVEKTGLLSSRFKFVHKQVSKPRCICIEHFETQWLQQALRRGLYTVVERHPLTKDYVRFTDQSVNGLLALLASRNSGVSSVGYTTMDMKEGSDRIFRALVEWLFQDNRELLGALLALSTPIIELPKDVPYHRKYIHAKKFAPMGSAICFPIMALVHFAMVKAIISCEPETPHINDIPVWVYGDDIIFESQYSEAVYRKLPAFGMKINVGKSYHKSLFRESCGVHAYNGVVITPTRFKTIVSHPLSTNDVVSALRNESALFYKGFQHTAELIRKDLLKVKQLKAKYLPVVGPKSPVLGWIRKDEDALAFRSYKDLRKRWRPQWYRYHYLARLLVETKNGEKPPLLSDDEYYLRAQVERPLSSRTIGECPTEQLSVMWAWLPDSAFYHA